MADLGDAWVQRPFHLESSLDERTHQPAAAIAEAFHLGGLPHHVLRRVLHGGDYPRAER